MLVQKDGWLVHETTLYVPRNTDMGGESAQTWVWESLLYPEVAYIAAVYPQIFPAIDTKLFFVDLRSKEG